MTYDQIVTLITIVEHGSFQAASQVLHRSQPSLSMAIKKLEEEFQVVLFDRGQYRPRLTSSGQLFYEKAKIAHYHMKELHQLGSELGMNKERELRIGIEGISPLPNILNILHDFFKNYPDVKLNLSVDYLSGTLQQLKGEEIDLAITPIFLEDAELDITPYCKVKMIPVIHSARYEDVHSIEELKQVPQVIIKDKDQNSKLSFGILEGGRQSKVSDMHTKYEIIKQGLGWGRLPDYLVQEDLEKSLLKIISFEAIAMTDEDIYLATSKHKPKGPILKKLIAKLSK